VARAQAPTERARTAIEAVALGSVAVTTRALTSVGIELTFAQWRVLVIVGEDSRGATVTEIAERLGADVSPASRLVTRLTRRGLVATRKDDQDRRVTRVTATEAGRTLRETVLDRRRRILTDVLVEAGPIGPEGEAILERIGLSFRSYT
jgi:DNA-binding MarR family transcriptional regulator